MLFFSLCLKDSTAGEFLVLWGRVFQMRLVEERNMFYYLLCNEIQENIDLI